MAHRLITPASFDPVSLEELKQQCRVDHDDEDTLIARLGAVATRHVEARTRRALLTQTWRLTLDAFPCDTIYIPRPPLIAVSSITYLDGAGDSQTLATADYRVDASRHPGRITPAYGEYWPTTLCTTNAVTITHTAGYGAAGDVPEDLRHAILLLAAHWHANRETVVVGTISGPLAFTLDVLCEPYEVEGYA